MGGPQELAKNKSVTHENEMLSFCYCTIIVTNRESLQEVKLRELIERVKNDRKLEISE